ncbi:hypothetical protein [Pollutibacter soli]|uniref:hypothetical protein n=1 Tax=Pollutibacter soli TaxID=3034157 RepID=UPI003013E25F
MKHLKSLTYLAFSVSMLSACTKTDNPIPDPPPPSPTDTVVTGSLTTNKTLTADKKWILKGYVYVTNGVTLTIEPGTTVMSDVTDKGALCIERGGKIMAEGTAEKPIVFTSGKAVGSRAPGDWGGIVLLGRARTNRSSTPVIEGGLDRPYGGTDDADNSGVMKYVRIEYAGIAAFANSEINALTLGAVGSGTTLEYIQTAYANDDAYEFFGGKVNAKHLVAAYTADDDYDFDFGFTGKIQYAVALRDPAFVDPGDAGNGIESDNDGSGTAALPYTRPVLSNFTFVGPNNAPGTAANHNFNARFRRASRFAVGNTIMMGYMDAGLSQESDSTGQAFASGLSVFSNNIVHAVANPYWIPSSSGTPTIKPEILSIAGMQTLAEAAGSIVYPSAADIKLKAPFNLTAPDLTPDAGSPALTGAAYTGDFADAFFTSGTYKGAIGSTNWLNGWTRFFANGQ